MAGNESKENRHFYRFFFFVRRFFLLSHSFPSQVTSFIFSCSVVFVLSFSFLSRVTALSFLVSRGSIFLVFTFDLFYILLFFLRPYSNLLSSFPLLLVSFSYISISFNSSPQFFSIFPFSRSSHFFLNLSLHLFIPIFLNLSLLSFIPIPLPSFLPSVLPCTPITAFRTLTEPRWRPNLSLNAHKDSLLIGDRILDQGNPVFLILFVRVT